MTLIMMIMLLIIMMIITPDTNPPEKQSLQNYKNNNDISVGSRGGKSGHGPHPVWLILVFPTEHNKM